VKTLHLLSLVLFTTGLALADIANQTQTLKVATGLNLDNGTVVSSGGDFLFTGTTLTYQGSATGFFVGPLGADGYNNVATGPYLKSFPASTYTTTAISGGALVANALIAVHTNAGNYAKLLIQAVSATSITIEFTTYGTTINGGPTVTDVQNNSSLIPDGFPNAGITPSTLFVIHGSNMATPGSVAVLQDSTLGLPATLNGASISVTVGGKTVTPAIYYSTPTQIAAVLPEATPTGTGTLTVTYNNIASFPATIHVVASAYGMSTFNGNTAVATDAVTGALLTQTNAGMPGEIIILWGTGLGADPLDSDTTSNGSQNPINVQVQAYFGGVQATNIAYVGGSIYPGVHVIGLTIPAGVPNGCFVPIAITVGGVTSNLPMLPIMDNGGVCSDKWSGYTGSQLSQVAGQQNVHVGLVYLVQSTTPGNAPANVALATFNQQSGVGFAGMPAPSPGGCIIGQTSFNGIVTPTTYLDPGTLSITPPGGTAIPVPPNPSLPGFFFASLPSGTIPANGEPSPTKARAGHRSAPSPPR